MSIRFLLTDFATGFVDERGVRVRMGRRRDERGALNVLTKFCFQAWIGVQWVVVVAMGGIAREHVKVFGMNGREFWTLEGVSDGEVEGRLVQLLAEGARTDARVVAHLAEVDARRLHLRGGMSLWEYCLRLRLGLSESEAYYRICAARAGRAFPVVFGLLERREVSLTTLALVGKYLTFENHLDLLAEVRGKTKRQVLEVLARRWPRAEVASEVQRLRARRFGQAKEVRKTARASAQHLGQAKVRSGHDVIRQRKHVPHEVRRQVAERDGYCCSYVSPSGQRCGARAFLELDHERPWARGGDDSVENLRLLCRAHNQFLAEREFGQRVPGRAG